MLRSHGLFGKPSYLTGRMLCGGGQSPALADFQCQPHFSAELPAFAFGLTAVFHN